MHAPNLCTVGQPAPDTYEVVWNGAMDRLLSTRPVASAVEPSPYQRLVLWNRTRMHSETAAKVNRGSTRLCDRLLVYLVDHGHEAHTGTSVGRALGIPQADAGSYLRRHADRGFLTRSRHTRHGGYRTEFRVVEVAR